MITRNGVLVPSKRVLARDRVIRCAARVQFREEEGDSDGENGSTCGTAGLRGLILAELVATQRPLGEEEERHAAMIAMVFCIRRTRCR
jgi:hypothetical protein